MSKIILILFTIVVIFITISLLFILNKKYKRSIKNNSYLPLIPSPSEQEYNPDINTNSWDLHKKRLTKFGRSQYKGLTFFVSSENKIYYLTKERTKFYC